MNFNNSVTFFRHGKTLYSEQPGDLTPEGVGQVEKSAEALARVLVPNQPIIILSSPRYRAQYTASVVARVLAAHGFNTKQDDFVTIVGLDEVRNFTWLLLKSLVEGGTVQLGNGTYEIDPKLTNPAGLSVGKYFNGDFAHRMPSSVRAKLPSGYLLHVDAMEHFSSVVERFITVLGAVFKEYAGTSTHVVMTGHDATSGYPAEVFSSGKLTGVQPGESIDIMFGDKQAFVTRVGDNKEGRSNVDLFTAYHEFF